MTQVDHISYEKKDSTNVPVTGHRAMIMDCLIPEIEAYDIGNFGFQQGGATCHAAR